MGRRTRVVHRKASLGGGTAVVVGTYAGKVTLIDTRTRYALAQVSVGAYPVAAAIAG